jgi:hypothetical protein
MSRKQGVGDTMNEMSIESTAGLGGRATQGVKRQAIHRLCSALGQELTEPTAAAFSGLSLIPGSYTLLAKGLTHPSLTTRSLSTAFKILRRY